MNITLQEYNTAIEGQKTQSALLRRQVEEVIGQRRQLAAQLEEQKQGIEVMSKLIGHLQDESRNRLEAITQFARYARGEEAVVDYRNSPTLEPLFNAISDLLKKSEDVESLVYQFGENMMAATKYIKTGIRPTGVPAHTPLYHLLDAIRELQAQLNQTGCELNRVRARARKRKR